MQLFGVALMISSAKLLHMHPVLNIQHMELPELSCYVQSTGLVNCYKALNLSVKSQSKGTHSATGSKGKQQPPVTQSISDSHDPCLCVVGDTCFLLLSKR